MPDPPRPLPMLNLLGRDALLGLVYRALAADADPAQAQLSLRRIEQGADDYTVLMQRRSQLRGMLEIAGEKTTEARRDANRLDLDLQLFNERYAPPPPKRGLALLAPRRTREQLEHDAERKQLEQQVTLAKQDANDFKAKHDAMAKQAALVEQAFADLTQTRETLATKFRGEVAAGVLSLVALDQSPQAREVLSEGRRMLRGDLILAVLWVLTALFTDGPTAAQAALDEGNVVWGQHSDPAARVLDGLIRVVRGEELNRQALGIFPRDNFAHAGLWRLYLLTGALAAWPLELSQSGTRSQLLDTLQAVLHARAQGTSREWDLPFSPSSLAAWAAKQDLVARTLVSSLLLQCGKLDQIPYAAGYEGLADVPPLHYIARPKKPGMPWPELLPRLRAQKLTAWPLPLAADWAQALACHVLLAAQTYAPPELFEQWLDESRSWPTGTLQWWTQAELRNDASLLSNLRADPGGLFVLRAE